jgi:hypothetical protein
VVPEIPSNRKSSRAADKGIMGLSGGRSLDGGDDETGMKRMWRRREGVWVCL